MKDIVEIKKRCFPVTGLIINNKDNKDYYTGSNLLGDYVRNTIFNNLTPIQLKDILLGPPKSTVSHSVAELESMGLVGVYLKNSSET